MSLTIQNTKEHRNFWRNCPSDIYGVLVLHKEFFSNSIVLFYGVAVL